MLNTTATRRHESQVLTEVWNNKTYLGAAGLRFEGNSNEVGGYQTGYGADLATTPTQPIFKGSDRGQDEEGTEGGLIVPEFFSGDRLNFTISFEDAIGQKVNVSMNLTTIISHETSENSTSSPEEATLDLSGQRSADMDDEGLVSFTGTRLRGKPSVTYTLRVGYEPSDESLTYVVNPSDIRVTMTPCRLGEKTIVDGEVTECQECSVGTFGKVPSDAECEPCADIDNGNCNGNTVVPNKDYWHSTSVSLKMYPCIGAEACDFPGRNEAILTKAADMHEKGKEIYYMDESDLLCRKVCPINECGNTLCCSCRDIVVHSVEAVKKTTDG